MQSQARGALETAKRACNRCFTYKTFRPKEDDKEIAKSSCRHAYEELQATFEEMRRNDDSTPTQLENLRQAKGLCLDAIDACNSCKKETPKIKEFIMRIK